MQADIDACVRIAASCWSGGYLERMAAEGDGVIIGHSALILKAKYRFRIQGDRPGTIGRAGASCRVAKASIMLL